MCGRTILIVEDEPLVAWDVAETIKRTGASVLLTHTLKDGLRLADDADISAAVLDFGLIDGKASELCQAEQARRAIRALQRLQPRGRSLPWRVGRAKARQSRGADRCLEQGADTRRGMKDGQRNKKRTCRRRCWNGFRPPLTECM
jgi:CheY-like chemotaxis protein